MRVKYGVFANFKFVSAYNSLCNMREISGCDDFDRVMSFIRKIDFNLKVYLRMFRNLEKRYGTLNSEGRYEFKTKEEASSRYDQLNKLEFNLDHEKFKLPDEIKLKLNINELLALEKFFII